MEFGGPKKTRSKTTATNSSTNTSSDMDSQFKKPATVTGAISSTDIATARGPRVSITPGAVTPPTKKARPSPSDFKDPKPDEIAFEIRKNLFLYDSHFKVRLCMECGFLNSQNPLIWDGTHYKTEVSICMTCAAASTKASYSRYMIQLKNEHLKWLAQQNAAAAGAPKTENQQ